MNTQDPQQRRWMLSTIAAAICCCLVVLYAYNHMAKARDRALGNADELTRIQRMALQIESLQHQPAVASVAELGGFEISRRIQEACDSVSLDHERHLARIDPEPLRRVGRSDYLEKRTRVELQEATLDQLLRWMHLLTVHASETDDAAVGPGLTVTGLRVQAPPGQSVGNLWDAEITLSYLVYRPPS